MVHRYLYSDHVIYPYCTELFGFFWTLSIVWYVEVLQKTTTFRRLDLFPSLSGWGRVDLLSWARQKELVSVIDIHHRQNPFKSIYPYCPQVYDHGRREKDWNCSPNKIRSAKILITMMLHVIMLEFFMIILITFREGHNLQSSSLHNFLSLPLTYSF
jgi:hypothetical protein